MSEKSVYKPGDSAWIVESGHFIRRVYILRISGDFVTLRFADCDGGIRVRISRLYPDKEAAIAAVKAAGMKPTDIYS